MAIASEPDISGLINYARTFLIRQAGLLSATLELDSFEEAGDHFVIVFKHMSMLYGGSKWTVELDKSGKVLRFHKENLSKRY